MSRNRSKVMPNIEEELYAAVSNSDEELIKSLLKQGADVNIVVQCGRTLLGRATQIGNVKIVQLLLDAEKYLPPEPISDVTDTQDPTSDVPVSSEDSLMSRVESHEPNLSYEGGLELFHRLRKTAVSKRQCDVNLPDFHDRMPIHYAVESGKVEVIKLLIAAGSRVNVSDSDNITPLHLAVSRGYESIVEVLLKSGSRVNSKTSDRTSALHIAASRGFLKIIDMLLQYRAKVDILDSSERTPLLLAIARRNHEVVQQLLSHGAKVNVEEIHGYTPLVEAVWTQDYVIVSLLLEAGAKINGCRNLIHYCVRHDCLLLCQLLIKFGALINVRDERGDTPLHLAVRSKHLDILKMLLEHGSNPNLGNGISGQTAIHEAVEEIKDVEISKFTAVLELLIQYGGNLNAPSFTLGDTPLYRAILLDKFLVAEELIRNGSDANLGNVYSCNIDNLCLARRKNHFRTVQLLVYSGFDLRITPWLEILPSNIPYSYSFTSVKGWLIYMKTNPLRLSDLCRLTIRRAMQDNIVSKVNKLPTPMPIKNFLLFRNIAFVKEENTTDENVENANVFLR